ncbi:penicillin-binding protein, partial [Streptomyces sp. SID7499]|nr:penicillin-binding protein [Streptomyces sp. SID7499]
MRSGAKVAVIGGVFVLMAGGIGYGAYSMLGDTIGGDGGTRSASESSKVKTGPPSAEEIAQTSKGFLDAWAAGDATAASLLTNNETGAEPVLAS